MNKKRILLSLGLLFIILPFFFNVYNIFRIISLALGIFLFTLSMALYKSKNIFLIIIIPIILIALSYGFDILLYTKLKRLPIYVYEVKSSDSVSTYNSLFYRIYKCDQNLTLDYGYKLDYVCQNDQLNTIDINNFLTDPEEAFVEYRTKFVRLHGKISKITELEKMELASYSLTDTTLNGYVNFNLNNVVSVKLKKDLTSYRIYDFADVIGRVDDLIREEDKKTIVLTDAVVIPSYIYNNYSYEIIKNSDNTLTHLVDDYYLYGLKEINIKYDNENIYSLNYLITDNRINWNILTNKVKPDIIKNKDNEEILKKYTLTKFNLAECNGKKIIVSKDIKIDNKFCSEL